MKKIVVLILLIVIISAGLFVPVTQQQTVSVKSSFLKVYRQLSSAESWGKWRSDLKQHLLSDSNAISIKRDSNSFAIGYPGGKLNVKLAGGVFIINENNNNGNINYSYAVTPDKLPNKTIITVNKQNNLLNYLTGAFKQSTFSDTHIAEFKGFMETDSLYYGCKIFKTGVPGSNLIVIRKSVTPNNKFAEAAKMFDELQRYVKIHQLKQIYPVIAQFIPNGIDSTQVNVGFFIDREVSSAGDITYMRMPKGGPLYGAKFQGSFAKRQLVYTGIHQYFTDHLYQSAILPFETYLDNKLPVSDTGRVNVQVNFTTFF